MFATQHVLAQLRTITGKVSSNAGEPIVGATINANGTETATTSDASGNFRINVPEKTKILEVSFIGMETKEVTITGQTAVTISLNFVSNNLNDVVVVVGYSKQKKVSLTSAVSVISADDLSRRPVTNSVQSLQGLAPSLTILDQGGAPGSARKGGLQRGFESTMVFRWVLQSDTVDFEQSHYTE